MTKRPERIAGGVANRLGLLSLIAAILVALVGFLAPPSSASTLPHTQTRVAAIEQLARPFVGPDGTVLPGESRERAPSYDQTATGSSVAVEGELIPSSQAFDPSAQALADRIGGQAQVEFATGSNAGRELDAVSSEYVAQTKPANFGLSQAFRVQAKATFQAAIDSGRIPYFQFDGPPQSGVIQALQRYAQRYGIQPVIDTQPLP